jgi:hypothetical protein
MRRVDDGLFENTILEIHQTKQENTKNLRRADLQLEFKPCTFRIQVRHITTVQTCLVCHVSHRS